MTAATVATRFHAGRFLSEMLEGQGHDVQWLAAKTGIGEEAVRQLLGRSNMDAALFVQMGEAVTSDFLQRLEAVMFE
ncbi:MAG: hypothetical protein IKW85_04340 [Muribaculaceae bacterium]|nr:hypothetical protein [Muribaculaceae bacterium]